MADWLRHRARLRHGNEAHAWGRRGEDLAHRYLQSCGYRIVARNWRTRNGSGEVDIVALDGDTIVFVEVKTRATDVFGAPEDAVDEAKRRHLFRAASEYLKVADADMSRARFDIVSVLFDRAESVVHHRDAIAKPAPEPAASFASGHKSL
jgi:putative endonuclease